MKKSVWAGIVSPGDGGTDRLLRVQAAPAELARLLDHWLAMQGSERPELRGLTVAGGLATALELLLEQDGQFAVLRVSGDEFARPSKVWPHSLWWEEELRALNGIVFTGQIPERDAAWQPL